MTRKKGKPGNLVSDAGRVFETVEQLAKAIKVAGGDPEEFFQRLRSASEDGMFRGDVGKGIVQLLRKSEEFIDCQKSPFVYGAWKGWHSHARVGWFQWAPEKVTLYRSRAQENGHKILGLSLLLATDFRAMNANVLDWLLAHPENIPEEWKDKYVYFFGTVYLDEHSRQRVRFLFWSPVAETWGWGATLLESDWASSDAVLLATTPFPVIHAT